MTTGLAETVILITLNLNERNVLVLLRRVYGQNEPCVAKEFMKA